MDHLDADDVTPEPLDAADLSALSDYTGLGYREMNPVLRADRVEPGPLQERIDAVSTALQKLPKYDGLVFRGTRLTPEQIAVYEPGKVVPEKAFTSTSADPDRAFGGNVRFVIDSRTGRDVAPYSNHPEAEILFDRNTSFTVLDKQFDEKTGKTLIYLRETP